MRWRKVKAENVWRRIYQVSSLAFKDSILKVAQTRSDDVEQAIIARIAYEYELIVAEDKYHHSCYNFFSKPSTGSTIGYPENHSFILAITRHERYFAMGAMSSFFILRVIRCTLLCRVENFMDSFRIFVVCVHYFLPAMLYRKTKARNMTPIRKGCRGTSI